MNEQTLLYTFNKLESSAKPTAQVEKYMKKKFQHYFQQLTIVFLKK